MIENLYKKYFQKSKVFLYPMLELEKCFNVDSTNTYLYLKDDKEDNMYLYVLFKISNYNSFNITCRKKMVANKLFKDIKILSNKEILMIFDLQPIADDYRLFIEGKYSKISESNKKKIMKFFSKDKNNAAYVESYLYPDKYYTMYSDLLMVSLHALKKSGQLCDKINKEKETLQYTTKELEMFTNSINIANINLK